MTSLASQLGSLSYLTEGSARRKEILAKFLDLEIFERKFKIAKEEVAELKASIKRLEGREFPEEIKEARTLLARNEASLSLKERECKDIENKVEELQNKHAEVSSLIESIPAEIIDISDVIILVNIILDIYTDTIYFYCSGNMNNDLGFNVTDIIYLLDKILEG